MSVRNRMKTMLTVENPADDLVLDQATNIYGDLDESNVTNWTATQTLAYVVPVGSAEAEDDRETRARTYTVFVGQEIDVRGTSKLYWTELQGTEREVEIEARVLGDPQHFDGPRGPSHTVVRAEVIEG